VTPAATTKKTRGESLHRRSLRTHRAILAATTLLLVAGDVPQTRFIELRWTHEGNVAGFKVYTHHWGQAGDSSRNVGLPEKKDGVYTVQIEVSNYQATYVTLTAYDSNRRESPRSNERLYLLPDPATEKD